MLKRVFGLLLSDYSEEELSRCASLAYKGKFDTDDLTPLTKIGDEYLLELYHGPTQAFKDMALCMLPLLMGEAAKDTGKKIMIVTATSGDTGKAALSGFRNAPGVYITVFFPQGGVSDIQYLQMVTEEGSNCFAAGVTGNFDDCQNGVKKIFETSPELSLSSANSINVGRLVPQVVYYFEAYRKLLVSNEISLGDKVDFTVPTGNFGDVLAGYYAKMLGLPVGRLIVASNDNNVLYDFIKTGVYDRKRQFFKTISPSMDILISSNLERFLYYASGCDCGYVKSLMEELKETGSFTVNEKVFKAVSGTFDAGYSDVPACSAAIKEAWYSDGRLIDPHTAVALKVSRELKGKNKMVILSTASPYKFAKDVYRSIFGDNEALESGFSYMKALNEKTGERIPEALSSLENKPVKHKSVCDPSEMKAYVLKCMEKCGM